MLSQDSMISCLLAMKPKQKIAKGKHLLLESVRNPHFITELNTREGELLLQLARPSKLLAHLGSLVKRRGLTDQLPEKIVEHFQAAQVLADQRKRLALWELNRLWRALLDVDFPVVILKGGAYLLKELPLADGRLVSDVDILVEKDNLHTFERTLIEQGWCTAKLDEYDQSYYRKWMHEIPPLRHRERIIEVDIHHTILPLTSRLRPDGVLLVKDSVESGKYQFKVLAPCDMLLHSSVHLFYNAELNEGDLRDLVDQDELIRALSRQDAGFWNKLLERGRELQLLRPLYYSLHFSHKFLDTPVPDEVWSMLSEGKPSGVICRLMDFLVPLAILPDHPDFPQKRVGIARWLLYVRSHYLRMPLHLLIPHLFHKSGTRFRFKKDEEID